jgi:hypothetical protein
MGIDDLQNYFVNISTAINNKAGTKKLFKVTEFADAILNIKQNYKITGTTKIYHNNYPNEITLGDFVSLENDIVVPYNNKKIFGLVTAIDTTKNTLEIITMS